jgi:hypothetical protein
LGSRDRLIDFRAECGFSGGVREAGRLGFGTIEGAGHVVLVPAVIEQAGRQLSDWFWAR